MVSSACEVLLNESKRFVDYLFADAHIREKIVDRKSFNAVLLKVLQSDSSLANIPTEMNKNKETMDVCGQSIYDEPVIQQIVKRNIGSKKREFSKRVSTEKPTLTRSQKTKEVNRRLNIYIASATQKVQQTKQVTIDEAFQPVKVKEYKRGSQVISSYRKTEYKSLTAQEEMLLENGIKRGKKPSEVVKDYMQSGLGFRTDISIKRHYARIKEKISKGLI